MPWARRATPPEFELERFELIQASLELSLLRTSGHWRSRARPAGELRLVARRDGRTVAFGQLPQPGGMRPKPDGAWRAGFSVPSDVAARAYFALEAEPDVRIELPRPAGARALPAPVPHAELDRVGDENKRLVSELALANLRIRELQRALEGARTHGDWQRRRSAALQEELRSLVETGQRSEGALERQLAVVNRARTLAGNRSGQAAELERRLTGIRDRLVAEDRAAANTAPQAGRIASIRSVADARTGELEETERRLAEIRESLIAAG